MTTPAQPDTGAGSQPDTGSAPEDPSTDAQPTAPDTDVTDWQAEAEKYKALARKHETRAKESRRALEQAAQPKDGDDLQQQLADAMAAREAAEERSAELAYTGTVSRIAATVNADPDALLDSDSFRTAVAEELGDDFDDDDLRDAVTKVAKAFAKKPRFAANTPTASPRGGADMTGGTPPPARERPKSLHAALKNRQQ